MKMMPSQNSPLGSPFWMMNCSDTSSSFFGKVELDTVLCYNYNPQTHPHLTITCSDFTQTTEHLFFLNNTRPRYTWWKAWKLCEVWVTKELWGARCDLESCQHRKLSPQLIPGHVLREEEASAGWLALGPSHHPVKDAGINTTALAWTWAVTQSGKAVAGKGLKMVRTECTISIGSAACWHEELGQCHSLLVSSITELSTDEGERTSNHS